MRGLDHGVDFNLTFNESRQQINEKLRVIIETQMLESLMKSTFAVRIAKYRKEYNCQSFSTKIAQKQIAIRYCTRTL